jgi:hypothetical protein
LFLYFSNIAFNPNLFDVCRLFIFKLFHANEWTDLVILIGTLHDCQHP